MVDLCMILAIVLTGSEPPSDETQATRPAWVELAKNSQLPLHCEGIESELWATRDEARTDAMRRAAARVREFAAEVSPRVQSSWEVPTWLVQDHLLKEPIYIEESAWKYGPMFRAHVLLDLSPSNRDVVLSKWYEVIVRRRIHQVAVGIGFVLICLTTLFTYLRLDDATRGYYSRWLAGGAAAVVAGSAAALYTWLV